MTVWLQARVLPGPPVKATPIETYFGGANYRPRPRDIVWLGWQTDFLNSIFRKLSWYHQDSGCGGCTSEIVVFISTSERARVKGQGQKTLSETSDRCYFEMSIILPYIQIK
jgi:hypothetical protein